jgi:hypothetical protein
VAAQAFGQAGAPAVACGLAGRQSVNAVKADPDPVAVPAESCAGHPFAGRPFTSVSLIVKTVTRERPVAEVIPAGAPVGAAVAAPPGRAAVARARIGPGRALAHGKFRNPDRPAQYRASQCVPARYPPRCPLGGPGNARVEAFSQLLSRHALTSASFRIRWPGRPPHLGQRAVLRERRSTSRPRASAGRPDGRHVPHRPRSPARPT